MSEHRPSPEYIGYRLEVFVAVFTPFQVVAVALRFYARSLTAAGLAADDWLVLSSLLGQIVAGALGVAAVRAGAVGFHVDYLAETNPEAITVFFKYLIAMSSWYFVIVSLSKLGICVLYRRLFPQRAVYIVLLITVGILIGAPFASLVANLAACRPFEANWGPVEEQRTHCIDKEPLFVWSTFPNIITDAILLTLPLPIVLGLAASILRFLAFANNNSFIDATFAAVELIIWTIAEPGIYLVSACLLTYRPILDKFNLVPRSSLKTHGGSTSRGGSRFRGTRGTLESHQRERRLESGDSSVALRTITVNGGFEPDDTPDRNTPRSTNGAPNRITITTNINQTWGEV